MVGTGSPEGAGRVALAGPAAEGLAELPCWLGTAGCGCGTTGAGKPSAASAAFGPPQAPTANGTDFH
jgi:hypothetical protein